MKGLEAQFRHMLLARERVPFEGMSERSQQVYRRQVRKALTRGVKRAIPIAGRLVGKEALDDLLARWLADSPPTTRLYWQLPLAFCAWFVTQPDPLHPSLPELIHWETIEVDVLLAEDPAPGLSLAESAEEGLRPVLHPSARLCIYQHPVHTMTTSSESWPEAMPAPAFIVAYRRQERLHWCVVAPQIAQLLAALMESEGTLGEGFAFLSGMYGQVDRAALVAELEALVGRGALLGFVA